MTASFDIAVLIGSLRANSFSSRLAKAVEELAPEGMHFRQVPIGDLPHYNQDLDGDTAPASYAPFRKAIAAADGILFVTPEYNRSIPSVLKNAIDVGSRPMGAAPINGKPAAIISQSPGAMGGYGANHAIRQSLVALNMPVVQQPEIYLSRVSNVIDDEGKLTDDSVRDLLTKFAAAFRTLIQAHRSQA